MNKYLKCYLIPIILILVLPIIFSVFNLFNIKISKIIYLLTISLIMIYSGYSLGKIVKNKLLLKGILSGIVISLIFYLISLILHSEHSIFNVIYYLIIVAANTLGMMINALKK